MQRQSLVGAGQEGGVFSAVVVLLFSVIEAERLTWECAGNVCAASARRRHDSAREEKGRGGKVRPRREE